MIAINFDYGNNILGGKLNMKKAISIVLTVFMTLSMFSCLGVASYAVNAVESFSYEMNKPIEIIEGSSGYWDTRYYNDENGEEQYEEYFHYYLPYLGNYIDKFIVNYADGTSEEFINEYNEMWDEWCYTNSDGERIDYSLSDNQYEEPWTLGEDNSFKIEINGTEMNVPVAIIENPISSAEFISVSSIELVEGVNGNYYGTRFEYSLSSEHLYRDGNILKVNYSDGTSVEYVYDSDIGDFCDENNTPLGTMGFGTSSDQDEEWVVGGQYSFNVSFYIENLGISCCVDVPVSILENPVASIEYTMTRPVEFVENCNGEWVENWLYDNETCEEYCEEFFNYHIGNYWYGCIDKFTVNYTDGTSEDFVYSEIDNEKDYYNANGEMFAWDQRADQYDKHWMLGDDNYFKIIAYGREVTVPVSIVESNVASISFTPEKPIEITQNGDCWFYTQELYQRTGNKITLTYKDGSSEDFIYDGSVFVSESGEYLRGEYFDVESQQRWDSVGTYSFDLGYLGVKTQVYVNVVSHIVSDVSFTPVKPVTYIMNYGFSIYEIGNVITITYSDGRVVDYEFKNYENENLPYYDQGLGWYDKDNNILPSNINIYTSFDYDNISVGNTYTATLEIYDNSECRGVTTEFPIAVIENPVESISVDLSEEIKLIHNIDSTHGMETGDSNIDYYHFDGYRIPDGTAVTVNYKDGTSDVFYKKLVIDPSVIEYFVMFLNEDNESLDYELYTNQSDNPWVVGTNYAELSVYGVTTEIPVTVLPGPTSIVVTPPSPIQISEHTCGCWVTDMDNGTYYQYYPEYVCGEGWKVVLNYEDGSVKEYTTSIVDAGEWYAIGRDESIQLYTSTNNQSWEIGEDNYMKIEYGALSALVPVTIVDSPEHELTVIEIVEATCTKSGYTTYYCSACDRTFDSDYVAKKGHNIVDGVCENCGLSAEDAGLINLDTQYEFERGSGIMFVAPETGYYKFASYGNGDPYIELNKDGESYYSDDSNGLDFSLTVYMVEGEIIEGFVNNYSESTIIFNVTYAGEGEPGGEGGDNDGPQIGDTIGEGDFEAEILSQNTCMLLGFCTDATEVTVPSQIRGYDVVCIDQYISDHNVEVLNLPATITELSQATFSWWEALKEINIAEDNTVYKSQNGIVYDYSLEEIIVIPNAFCGEIVIPLGTTELNNDMLAALENASKVSVAEGHTVFAEEDGIVYSSDFTKIYFAKTLPENYVMKESVTEFVPYAFAGNDEVKSVTISSNVTSIAYAAFNGCSALEAVELPEGLVSIEEAAFGHNTALKKIDLPSETENVDDLAFYNCANLKEVNFNDGLTQLGSEVFSRTAIEKAILPDSLSQMGGSVFSGCSALSQVKLSTGLYDISGGSFSGCTSLKQIEIPANIKEIWSSAFAVSGLTSVSIPDTVEYMASYAFGDCENLVSADIGKGVGIIERSFQSCDNLETVKFADGFNGVCKYAFINCPKLENVDIPNTVTEISYYQFKGCTSLDDFDIPSTLLKVDGHALDDTGWYNSQEKGDLYFKHILYGYKDTANDNATPENYTVDVSIGTKSIAYYAFQNQAGVTEVNLPYTMEYIGDYAFYNCANLTSIKVPANVTYIGEMAIGYSLQEVYNEYWDYYYYDEVANPDFIVYGVPGSVAETYAYENGLRFEATCAHSSTQWIVDEPATCKAEGSKHKECTDCKEILETEVIAKAEHTASNWIVDNDSTCTKEGSKHKECTECKEVLETAKIAKKNHTASSWKTDKKATVKSAGSKHKECTKCGKVLETAKIAQLKCSKPKLSKIENTADGVKITWGKVSGADKYYVYRKTSGSYKKIATTSKAYYTDKSAKSGKKYYYVVKAVNEAGSSDSSKSLSKLYLSDPTLKTPKSTKKGIKLEWSKVKGAEGYVIYYKTGSGSYKKLTTVKGSSKVAYTHTKAKKGKTYTYKVKAYKSKTYSAYSNAKKIKDKY